FSGTDIELWHNTEKDTGVETPVGDNTPNNDDNLWVGGRSSAGYTFNIIKMLIGYVEIHIVNIIN
ncbi:unnamed protein product, partial [marine sediment metagenome]